MARITVEVDRNKLIDAINHIETYKTFSNRTELYKEVAEYYNNKYETNRPVTHSVIYLRVKEFKLENILKTKPGKRGATNGERLAEARKNGQINRTSRADKIKHIDVDWSGMEKIVPETYHNHIDKARNGSLASAVILKCLDCCSYQPSEVRECTVKKCALYAFRRSALRNAAKELSNEDN